MFGKLQKKEKSDSLVVLLSDKWKDVELREHAAPKLLTTESIFCGFFNTKLHQKQLQGSWIVRPSYIYWQLKKQIGLLLLTECC